MKENDVDRKNKGWNPEANRRWFLRRLATLGGGAIAGWAVLISCAGLKKRPRGKATSVGRFKKVFQTIKTTGELKTPNKSWVAPLKPLSAADRLASVTTIEVSQRCPECDDLATKIAMMVQGALSDPAISHAVVHQATGGGCGGNCGGAKGYICGVGCFKVTDTMLQVDEMGNVLTGQDLYAPNIMDFSAAMTNTAEAYREVFGPP